MPASVSETAEAAATPAGCCGVRFYPRWSRISDQPTRGSLASCENLVVLRALVPRIGSRAPANPKGMPYHAGGVRNGGRWIRARLQPLLWWLRRCRRTSPSMCKPKAVAGTPGAAVFACVVAVRPLSPHSARGSTTAVVLCSAEHGGWAVPSKSTKMVALVRIVYWPQPCSLTHAQ